MIACTRTHDDFYKISMARTRDVNEEYLDIENLPQGKQVRKIFKSTRVQRISRTSESIPRYLANTRVSGNGGRDSKDG